MPMIIDTGAEISALPLSFFDTLFPGQAPPESVIRAFGFGGSTVRMRGPVTLRVEVCAITLSHSFYFYEDNPTFLMGYDLISAAALVIDPVNKCVWSKHPPTVVGQPDIPTDFTSSETSLKVADSEATASCLPVEAVYAVPIKGRPYVNPSCFALPSGPRAEVTLPGPRAPASLDSVVRPEHGLDSIRSPASPAERVDTCFSDALLSDSPLRPVPLCKNSGFIDPTSDYNAVQLECN